MSLNNGVVNSVAPEKYLAWHKLLLVTMRKQQQQYESSSNSITTLAIVIVTENRFSNSIKNTVGTCMDVRALHE